MALAIHFDELLRNGTVASYSELASLCHVTRPRISQIMALLNLAPSIQEAVLFQTRVERGGDRVHLHQLLKVASNISWQRQRAGWTSLEST
jgi:hypothetical protein